MNFNFGNSNPFQSTVPEQRISSEINGTLSKDKSVKLYLFSPYKRGSAVIRPLTWNRQEEGLYYDVANLIKERKEKFNSSMGGFIKNGFFLDKSQASNSAIMPSDNWHEFGSNLINDHGWKFILVINNEAYKFSSYNRNNGKKNRTIYTGFCIGDSPVVKSYGKYHINENACFYITHKTIVEVNERINSSGQYSLASVSHDVDVISGTMLGMNEKDIYEKRDYLLDPGEVLDSSIFINDGNGDRTIEGANSPSIVSLSSRNEKNYIENSIMNSPKHQANRVMSALFNMINQRSNMSAYDNISINNSKAEFYDDYGDKRVFIDYLKGTRPEPIEGLNLTNSYITFRDIINRYPNVTKNLEVLDLKGGVDEASYGFSEIEKAPNISSTLSSLAKSAIPPIMMDCGISEYEFRWASSSPNAFNTFKLIHEPEVKILNFNTIIPEDRDTSVKRAHDAMHQMEQHVFGIIKDIVGEFEIYVNYSSNKRIVVQLQLRDLTDKINDTYITGQCDLGGIISPMVGAENDYNANLDVLESFVYLSNNFKDQSSNNVMYQNKRMDNPFDEAPF